MIGAWVKKQATESGLVSKGDTTVLTLKRAKELLSTTTAEEHLRLHNQNVMAATRFGTFLPV